MKICKALAHDAQCFALAKAYSCESTLKLSKYSYLPMAFDLAYSQESGSLFELTFKHWPSGFPHYHEFLCDRC